MTLRDWLALPVPGTPRSRLSALVVLMMTAGMIAGGLVEPVIAAFGGRAAWQELEGRLQQYQAMEQRRPALAAELAALQAAPADNGDFLPGATPVLAAAELQSQLAALIRGEGAQVNSTQAIALADEQGFPRVGVQVHFATRIDPLRTILYRLEAGRPRLLIDRLTIRARPNSSDLDVGCDVVGYLPADAK